MMAVSDDPREAYGWVSGFVGGLVLDRRPAFTVLPFFDDMHRRVTEQGPEALLEMPADHWREIGAIGTMDDALAHVAALEDAGVSSVNIFPGDDLDIAWRQMEMVATLATR
jgi:5,10-methylenetetrahydromethanopterin reductase